MTGKEGTEMIQELSYILRMMCLLLAIGTFLISMSAFGQGNISTAIMMGIYALWSQGMYLILRGIKN